MIGRILFCVTLFITANVKYIEKYPGLITTTYSFIIVVLWKKLQITTTPFQPMGYSNWIIVFLLFVNICTREPLKQVNFSSRNKWVKVLKNGPSKICGSQPLKNLKRCPLPKQTRLSSSNFTWSILEYLDPNIIGQ